MFKTQIIMEMFKSKSYGVTWHGKPRHLDLSWRTCNISCSLCL